MDCCTISAEYDLQGGLCIPSSPSPSSAPCTPSLGQRDTEKNGGPDAASHSLNPHMVVCGFDTRLGNGAGPITAGTALDALVVAPTDLMRQQRRMAERDRHGDGNGDATSSTAPDTAAVPGTAASSDFVVQFPATEVSDQILALLIGSHLPPPRRRPSLSRRRSRSVDKEKTDLLSSSLSSSQDEEPRSGPYVQVWINGTRVPWLDMSYAGDDKGSSRGPRVRDESHAASSSSSPTQCRFFHGKSTRPSSTTLEALVRGGMVAQGSNPMEFRLVMSLGGDQRQDLRLGGEMGGAEEEGGESSPKEVLLAIAPANLHLWSSVDSVIVSDIDGTVTKSDVRGVFDTVVTEKFEHVHFGVCDLFQSLSRLDLAKHTEENGMATVGSEGADHGRVRFVYLSSRPISLINSTRRFLNSLIQGGKHRLPPGPIFCHQGGLSEVLLSELFHKNIHEFKADVLTRQIVLPFAAAGGEHSSFPDGYNADRRHASETNGGVFRCQRKLFLAGFGNKGTDAAAYEIAGIDKNDIYIIDKDSNVVCMDGCEWIASSSKKVVRREKGGSFLQKSVKRIRSLGSLKDLVKEKEERSNDSTATEERRSLSEHNSEREEPVIDENDCDHLSEQLTSTVESMLCGANYLDEPCFSGNNTEVVDRDLHMLDELVVDGAIAPPSQPGTAPGAGDRSTPLGRRESLLLSSASFKKNMGDSFAGYSDFRLAHSIRRKLLR